MVDYLVIAVAYLNAFLPLIGLAFVAFTAFVTGLTRPDWLVWGYLAVLLCNSQGGYGVIDGSRSLYSRGSGQLFFSFIILAIYGILLTSSLWKAFGGFRAHRTNLAAPAWGFGLLFVGNLIMAFYLDRNLVFEALGGNGFINIVHLIAFVGILLSTQQTPRHLNRIEWLILLSGAGRAVFGLVRFAAFGGDPANVYENTERLGVKLTYFDINDSLLAAMVLFLCARRLLDTWKDLSSSVRYALISLATMEIAVIALSYRRTALLGLALVMCFLLVTVKRTQRLPIFGAGVLAMLPAFYFMGQRLDAVARRAGKGAGFLYDIAGGSSYGAVSPRALELKYTLQSVLENPLFGLGAWGRYQGSSAISWQHEGGFSFVHSGILHILLKTGLVGGTLFAAAVVLFSRFVLRARKDLEPSRKLLLDSALAGLLFSVPNFLIGTPIIEPRTMLLLGFLIALPYIIHGVHVRETGKGMA